LALPRRLLDQLIRNVVSREFVAHAEAQLVVLRESASVARFKIAQRTAVGIVLRNHGIQIMIGPAPVSADGESILSLPVLHLHKSANRIEAPAMQRRLSMP